LCGLEPLFHASQQFRGEDQFFQRQNGSRASGEGSDMISFLVIEDGREDDEVKRFGSQQLVGLAEHDRLSLVAGMFQDSATAPQETGIFADAQYARWMTGHQILSRQVV
jgi:hypothetical protein